MIRHKSPQSGFTLVEAAMVVVIGGMLLTTATTLLLDYLQQIKIQTTRNRLQDINNALIQYVNINGVLPCVASMSSVLNQQDTLQFGVEVTNIAANGGVGIGVGYDCAPGGVALAGSGTWVTTGAIPPGQAFATNTATINGISALPVSQGGLGLGNGNGYIVIGAVPVRTLNLPDQDIADAWGDRFTYAVTDALTISTPSNEYDQTQGAISVIDGGNNYLAPSHQPVLYPTALPPLSATYPPAQYVIISYGADRAGAYTISGQSNHTPCPVPGTTEQPNCAAISGAPATPLTFVDSQITSSASYDDYVVYQTQIASSGAIPSGMIMPFALAGGCPPGWVDYSPPAYLSTYLTTQFASCIAPALPVGSACCQKQ